MAGTPLSDRPDAMTGTNRRNGRRIAATVLALTASLILFAWGYGTNSRRDAVGQAREQAVRRAALEASALVADVEKFRVLPYLLPALPEVERALAAPSTTAADRLDRTLRDLANNTGATVLYAVDRSGTARAASNAGRPDSFVGFDFRFRPYFIDAMRHGRSEYFARGSVTGRAGLFLAHRVGPARAPLGVVVVKIEFDAMERLWRSGGQPVFVIDRDGIILIGTDPAMRFHIVGRLAAAQRAAIARSRRFGDVTLRPSGLRLADGYATDAAGARFLLVEQPLPVLGWRHIHLEPLAPILAAADARTRVATLIVALFLGSIAGLAGWSATRRRRSEAARAVLEVEVDRRTAELTVAYDRLQRESDERALADSRYRAAREELAQANRLGSIGTITTSVAHELNQPLTAIRTASENGRKLLARGRTEEVEGNLSLIVALTQRIGTITGELLSYARRGRRERVRVSIDDAVDGALMLIGDSFRRAGVALDISRASPPAVVRVERIRLEQVLVNLLQNALDAVADKPDALVRLTAGVEGETVRLSVEDNGDGVAPELMEPIFQPFFTGKRNGTGLGLGISREIVGDYGGTLSVQPGPLGGASFVVTLPLDQEAER
jgi:two-component system C4-dicarboxylate transport sensor histidine kinase DctB